MGKKTKYIAKKPGADGIIPYTDEEHGTWEILFNRQKEIVQNRACDEYMAGLEKLNFRPDRIPQHLEVNEALGKETGWSVQAVAALIPAEEFFTLLANKTFPMASFIRIREELDYLMEPDIFHELFGHCPLLTLQPYADFMETFGKMALEADPKDRRILFHLFWFTIEFGLIQTSKGLKIYGGGILSSKEESVYALESDTPERIPLDAMTALRTPYRIDIIQPLYFITSSFSDLYKLIELPLLDMTQEAKSLGSFPPQFPSK